MLTPEIILQVTGVPSGPSPIGALVSLLALVIVLLVLGYVVLWFWRRIAGSVRYDERTQD